MELLRRFAPLALIAAVGCAGALVADGDKRSSYNPTADSVVWSSPSAAEQTVKELGAGALIGYAEPGRAGKSVERIRDVVWGKDTVTVQFELTKGRGVRTGRCSFADLESIRVRAFSAVYLIRACGMTFQFRSEDQAKAFADALYVRSHSGKGPSVDPAEAKTFEAEAARYRALAVKPALPEEARRFKVQAEAAVRDKRFDRAVERYAQVFKVAPWWPEGRFNRALILGELGRYTEAIREMNRYLKLVPNASDARKAQDKIYEWEDK